MEFEKLVKERTTIRKFSSEPIDDSIIKEILEIATCACNSGNAQNWEFVVVNDQNTKQKISDILSCKANVLNQAIQTKRIIYEEYSPQEFYLNAPVIIFAFATGKYETKADIIMEKLGHSKERIVDLRSRGDIQTVAAAIQLILLAAWAKGIGGCWMTGPLYARYELEEFFKIDYDKSLVAMIPLGRPMIIPKKQSRKDLEQVVRFFKNNDS